MIMNYAKPLFWFAGFGLASQIWPCPNSHDHNPGGGHCSHGLDYFDLGCGNGDLGYYACYLGYGVCHLGYGIGKLDCGVDETQGCNGCYPSGLDRDFEGQTRDPGIQNDSFSLSYCLSGVTGLPTVSSRHPLCLLSLPQQ